MPQENGHKWTFDTLKEYMDLRIDAKSKETDIRLELQDKAVDLAAEVLSVKLDGLNHLREQQKEFVATAITRQEYIGEHKALVTKHESDVTLVTEKVDTCVRRLDRLDNIKIGGNIVWAYIIAAISLVITIIMFAVTMIEKAGV